MVSASVSRSLGVDRGRAPGSGWPWWTEYAVLRHGIETGEADSLPKPFTTTALAAKLRQVLDRS